MAKGKTYTVSIEIDKLANSIVNSISGDSFATEVTEVTKADLKNVSKRNGWLFSWTAELKLSYRKVYKLSIKDNPGIMQGLVGISDYNDHFYLHLIESAPFNLGKKKLYQGVPGNLFAFTCKCAWGKGYQGFVSFISKTKLITHYENALGATNIGG